MNVDDDGEEATLGVGTVAAVVLSMFCSIMFDNDIPLSCDVVVGKGSGGRLEEDAKSMTLRFGFLKAEFNDEDRYCSFDKAASNSTGSKFNCRLI